VNAPGAKLRGVAIPARTLADGAPRTSEAGSLSPELRQAISSLYTKHHPFVWRNARRLGCTDEWVDDAVHEVFFVVARRWSEFQGRANERTWLFAITFRVVQRLRRNRATQRSGLQRYTEERSAAATSTAVQHESAEYLRYLLTLLPEPQQLVLILVDLEGFTSTEVAETLGIPIGTVHSRLRMAKQQLARIVAREQQQDERLDR